MATQEIDQAENEDLELSRTIQTSQGEIKVFKPKSSLWSELSKQLPILVTIVGLVWGIYQFNAQQAADTNLQAKQQAENAAQTLDQQRQSTLDTYLDRMSDLLLIDNLLTSKPNSPVRAIAEARTLTALRDLDGNRRAQLVRFLWKAGLDTGNNPVVSLNAAPLKSTLFQHALLMSINLSGALLINSTFDDCNLTGANFTQAELPGAKLTNVNLRGLPRIN
jgi:Pentapeptide repeats (8 copies)